MLGLEELIFCYGTLQEPEVVKAVLGRGLHGVCARLPDFAAFRLKGMEYPSMAPSPGSETIGLLYTGVNLQDLALLDAFEGHLYERKRSKVFTEDGKGHEAWTYVVRERYRKLISREPWHLERFIRQDMKRFIDLRDQDH